MFVIPCPWCGPREQAEFHCGGEAHIARPTDADDAAWAGYLYLLQTGAIAPLWGIDGLRFGMIGMPVSLIAMVVVSLATAPPPKEIQDMVDETRLPSGATILNEQKT